MNILSKTSKTKSKYLCNYYVILLEVLLVDIILTVILSTCWK